MKYMILMYGSQQDYDALAGKPATGKPPGPREDFAAMGAFMENVQQRDLIESGRARRGPRPDRPGPRPADPAARTACRW